VEQLTKESDKV